MNRNSTDNIFGINKKYWRKNQGQGAHTVSTRVGGALAPWARPLPRGPLELQRPQLRIYIFTFGEEKSERRIHRVLKYGAAAKP